MSDQKIKEAVQKLSGTHLKDEVFLVACSVNSVDQDSGTCEVTTISSTSEITIPNVLLQAEVSDGLFLVPKVDSVVFVAYTKRVQPYIALFSDLDYVGITVGGTVIEIKNGSIAIGDGSYGGLIKIQDLVTKLNNLENAFNDLVAKYNLHVHAGNGTPTVSIETTVLTPTQKADLENTVIAHGK